MNSTILDSAAPPRARQAVPHELHWSYNVFFKSHSYDDRGKDTSLNSAKLQVEPGIAAFVKRGLYLSGASLFLLVKQSDPNPPSLAGRTSGNESGRGTYSEHSKVITKEGAGSGAASYKPVPCGGRGRMITPM